MNRPRYIPGWPEKRLTCCVCGEKRSVKYEIAGETYCNLCVLRGKRKKPKEAKQAE